LVKDSTASVSPIDVGCEKQLFIDNWLIESREGVSLTMNPPKKTGEKLIVADKPWEAGGIGAYKTVINDGGIYKMWYQTGGGICYAYSMDNGAHWIKPSLGIVEYQGSKDNNIVYRPIGHPYGNCHGPTVFKDPTEPDGSPRKYKMFYWMDRHKPYELLTPPDVRPVKEWQTPTSRNMGFAFSPDGLNWTPWNKNPVMKCASDTQNVAFWDDRIGKYVAYVRLWDPWRVIGRSETADLASWPDPKVCLRCDEKDPENMNLYTNACIKYPYAASVYFMFPAVFYREPGERHRYGPLDVQLAVSRNGGHWSRPDRRPFICLGIDRTWDSQRIYVGVGITREGDQLSIYYTGYDTLHGEGRPYGGVISRAVLRVDGFVSADAGYWGGTLITKPLVFSGDCLELNVDTGAGGSLLVEVQDFQGKPIPGFTQEDAQPVRGNYIVKQITWKEKNSVDELAGKLIKLKFIMRDTKLYAFQFSKRVKV